MLDFLKNNKFFCKLAGINLLSKVGDRLFYTAMLTIATSLPNGSFAIMIVSASETLPILVSLFLGVVADRQTKKSFHLVNSSLFRMFMYIGIGFIFKYPPTLLLVIIAAFLNLLSDICGNYSTALFSPFSKILVKKDDMEHAQGLISLGSQLITALSTLLGSAILVICTESSLAFINATIFLFVALLYMLISSTLRAKELNIQIPAQQKTCCIVKENFKSFCSDHMLLVNLIQLAMLNGFFGGLIPIFALFINTNNEIPYLSNPIKISILSGIITLSMIIGTSLSTSILRQTKLYHINIISDAMILFIGSAFILNNLLLIFVANGCIAFLLGIVSPRFSADIVNRYPISRIGGIITSVNALLVIIPPITSLLFPLIASINISSAYIAFIIYAFLLIVISLFLLKTKNS